MAARSTDATEDRTDPVPPGYRRVERPNGELRWIHEATGLCVDLLRYAKQYDLQEAFPDHYVFRLVVRPDGPGEPGIHVDRTTERDPVEMAREWMRAHPDGEVEG